MNLLKYFAPLYLVLTLICAQQPSLYYSAFTTNNFITSESWEVQSTSPISVYSDCGNIRLFGGYNLFGSNVSVMKMLQLPPHYKVQVKLEFWKLDGWDNEFFYIYLDESLAYYIQLANDGQNSQCGKNYNELQTNIDFTLSHSYYSIYIFLTTNLDELSSDESWGIRDFQLYLYLCPIGCLTCEDNDQIVQCIPWILLSSSLLSIIQSQFSYDGWLINNSFQQTSLCGNIPLFGGYQITGQNSIIQTTIDLPIHHLLKIQIRIAFIDSWGDEYLYIDIDNQRIISQQYRSGSGRGIENICGDSNQADRMQSFQFQLTHSQSQIIIKISTNLDEDTSNESFGIRDFQLFSFYESQCGNGIKEENEECDDGNLEPFDGCFMCQYSCLDECSYCLSGECLETLENQQISASSSSQLYYSKCDNDNLFQFDGCFDNQYPCPEQCSMCVKGDCLVCYKQLWILYQSQCIPECQSTQQFDNMQTELNQFKTQDCLNCFCILQQTYSEQCFLNCNNSLKCAECNNQCNDNCQDCQNGICQECMIAYSLNNNQCLPICGDGLIALNFEQCDDMNNIPYDGCFECQYQCDVNCLKCFNGFCQDQCQIGYQYMNNECIEMCGDGIITDLEECDDYAKPNNQNCQNCKLNCPQNCQQCEYGNCQICNSGYNLDYKSNFCIIQYDSVDNNIDFDFDGCYDLCNGELNNLCQVCKLSSQPYIILTYLGQIDNQQNVFLTFSQDIKLQSDTNLIDHLNLQIKEDVDANSYQINVIAIHNATKSQASNVEYQIQINFKSSIREFRYLKVKVETMILNEYNVELINYQQKIMLQPYIQPSEDLINKSNQGKKMNQVLSGSLGVLAILALIIGQQSIFLSLLQILQFQSYLKFINIKFPFNIIVYFEGNNIGQISYMLNLLNIQKFIKMMLVPFERFQISYQKFLYYQINSDLLSNFEGQIFQFFSLIISLIFMCFLQKFLQYLFKLPNITNLRVLRLLFFLQRYTFNFIKSYNLQSLTTVLRVNSWDLIFVAGLQVQCTKDITPRNIIQDIIGYLIIFGYIYLCFCDFVFDDSVYKSSKQFWQSKHQSMILLQKISFLIILIYIQYQQFMQILLLSTIQLTYLVYLFAIQPLENKLELINSIQMEISVLIFVLSSLFYCEMFSTLIDFERQIIIGWCQIFVFLSVLITRLLIELKQNQFLRKIVLLLKTNNLNPKANPHPLDNQN